MSHFAVLVIGPNIEEQLQPYHEFECTGVDDEYVQDVDETEQLRAAYESTTERKFRGPTGELRDPWSDEFYREPTTEEREKIGPIAGSGGGHGIIWNSKDWGDGLGYRVKVRFVPDGWEEVEIPTREVSTFRQYIADDTGRPEVLPGGRERYGWTEVTDLGPEGEVIRSVDRTNPNKKWDWYEVGGRWKGFLRTDAGPRSLALKCDVRFDLMRDEAEEKAKERWERAHSIIAGREWERWSDLIEGKDGGKEIDAARQRYHAQPVVQDFREDEELRWDGPDEFAAPLEEYVATARRDAVTTFAVLKDGQWYERGEMGWWGCVSNEVSREEWAEKFNELIEGLDPSTPLTIVDCHI